MSGRRPRSRVGIALAGGGTLGGIYPIGALLALEEALKGVRPLSGGHLGARKGNC